jgi:hypothetical protein
VGRGLHWQLGRIESPRPFSYFFILFHFLFHFLFCFL